MKYALILTDGAADDPVPELGGETPLEAARKPHTDSIAEGGRQGTVATVPKGFLPGSDVATLSVVGYDPHQYYTGRAPLEALARNLDVREDDLVFRCNFVTIVDGRMHDFTAGHISTNEASALIADLNARMAGERVRFYPGVSYRNLMIMHRAGGGKTTCVPPHDVPNQPVDRHLPQGDLAEELRALMQQARGMLVNHEINAVRHDLGENQVTDIWLWGQGGAARMPSFAGIHGVRGAAIAAVDLIRGIARAIGWELIDVPGATGYLDTNYAGKGRAAVEALDRFDMVTVHIEAPDEAGHQGDAAAKVKALEQIDAHIVGPVLEKLRTFDQWRIMLLPDHPTPVGTRVHSDVPPPFCMAGAGIESNSRKPFTESNARRTRLHVAPGHALMGRFLQPC